MGTGVTLVTSGFVDGHLVFTESPAASGGSVKFGNASGGLDVILYGTTTSNYMWWDESANSLKFANATISGASLAGLTSTSNISMANATYIRGTSTASNAYSLNAWGTAIEKAIEIKNSTGSAGIKIGFFATTPAVKPTAVGRVGTSTTGSTEVCAAFNSLLGKLEVIGLLTST